MKIIVFDLDDTLYDELTYVRSGFEAVAHALGMQFQAEPEALVQLMWQTLKKEGRGKVFNAALESLHQLTNKNVRRCVSIYRHHFPENLQLYNDAETVMQYLEVRRIPRYIVTDGNKLVQHRKLQALQLEQRMTKCFITHRYGVKHAKPSPYCFQKIAQIEKVSPADIVYIGDNIAKDFIGIKKLGFQTIRIMRGSYVSLERPTEYQAHKNVQLLTEIISDLI